MKQKTMKSLNEDLGLRFYPYFHIALFALAGFFFSGSVFANTVFLNAGPNQIRGVEFSIDVVVDSVSDIYGAAFDLKYDPEFLEVVDSSPGSGGVQPKVLDGALFNRDGADDTFLRAALEDRTPGVLVVGITRVGDAGGVSAFSDTVALSASFIAKKFGITSIEFSNQGLRDAGNAPIPASAWEGLSINILPLYGDVDANDVIDLQDALLILQLASRPTPFQSPAAPIVYPEAAVDVYGRIGLETAVYVLQFVSELRD